MKKITESLSRTRPQEKNVQKLESTIKNADYAVRSMSEWRIPGIEDDLAENIEDINRRAAESIAKLKAKAEAEIAEARREMNDEIQKSRDAKQQLGGLLKEP